MKIEITRAEIMASIKMQNKVIGAMSFLPMVEEITYNKVVDKLTTDLNQIVGVTYLITDDAIQIELPSAMLIDIMEMYGETIGMAMTTIKLLASNVAVNVNKLENKWLKK